MRIRDAATRTTAIVSAAGLAAAGLMIGVGGCTSDTADQTPSSAPAASATTSPELPAPVIVEPEQTSAEATVGETIVFNQPDPADTTISTDRPDVLELTQGSTDGSAEFNPAAVATAAGVAVVTIEASDGTTSQVTVTVRE